MLLTLDEYKGYLSRIRKYFPRLLDPMDAYNLKHPVVLADGTVLSPSLIPDTDFDDFDYGIPLSSILNICGCGDQDEVAQVVLEMLQGCSRFSHKGDLGYDRESRDWENATPIQRAFLYWLDQMGLTSHGCSVFGSFLTDKGELVEDLLLLWKKDKESDDEEHGTGTPGAAVGD